MSRVCLKCGQKNIPVEDTHLSPKFFLWEHNVCNGRVLWEDDEQGTSDATA